MKSAESLLQIDLPNLADLSAYKLIFFEGSSRQFSGSYREALNTPPPAEDSPDWPCLYLFLVPKDAEPELLKGDDFDRIPAHEYAGFPDVSSLPEGTLILRGTLGGALELVEGV